MPCRSRSIRSKARTSASPPSSNSSSKDRSPWSPRGRTAAGDPLENARLETVLVHPRGRREPLNLSHDNSDFRATLQPTEAGEYAIESTAYDGQRLVGSARAEFLVYDRDVELSTPAAD